jgi:hypothetical protein
MKHFFGYREGGKADSWYELDSRTGIITRHTDGNNRSFHDVEVVALNSVPVGAQLELLRLLVRP